MKISFRDGYRPAANLSAEEAYRELEEIRQRNGGTLATSIVVREGTAPGSALNPAFTLDKKRAVLKCWQIEARTLLRAIVLCEVEGAPSRPAFFHIPVASGIGEGVYSTAAVILSDEDLYSRAYGYLVQKMSSAVQAVNDLERAARKAGDPERLAVVGMVLKAVESAERAVKTLQRRQA